MRVATLALRIIGAGCLSILLMGRSHAAAVLITGANSGIGLEFARQYAAAGWTVIATHRHDGTPETLTALTQKYKNVRAERMDVTSVAEVRALSGKLNGLPIDVLINNAAVTSDGGNWDTQQFGKLDYELGQTMLTTNVLGPLLVAETFARQVASSQQKKIISITSTHASLTEPIEGSGAIFYRASKTALNRAMLVVADDLRPQGVAVMLIHPGSVQTERSTGTSNYPHQVTVQESVRNMIRTIDAITLKDSGRFILFDGMTLPW